MRGEINNWKESLSTVYGSSVLGLMRFLTYINECYISSKVLIFADEIKVFLERSESANKMYMTININ